MQNSPEDGAARIAAHLGLTATGFELIVGKTYAVAILELRALCQEFVFADHEEDLASDIAIAPFCAEFLPALFAAYKAVLRPDGPYSYLLTSVMQRTSPVIIQFLTSVRVEMKNGRPPCSQ
ncbi:hypothetical protein DFH09DRAFT_1309662 [Mycena vulgaris]|nr:hypothetical protein DFH09DRAFT_1309662 [Mycena vulgaris]